MKKEEFQDFFKEIVLRAQCVFDHDGVHTPIMIGFNDEGALLAQFVGCDDYQEAVRETTRTAHVTEFIFIAESWMIQCDSPDKMKKDWKQGDVSKDPDRKECLVVTACHPEYRGMAVTSIVRDEHSVRCGDVRWMEGMDLDGGIPSIIPMRK